jgi:TonB family protein
MAITARKVAISAGLVLPGLISGRALAFARADLRDASSLAVHASEPRLPSPISGQQTPTLPEEPMADHLVQKFYPTYPAQAIAERVSGTVVLRAVISPEGKVTGLKATNGPFDLRKPTLRAVAMWTYKPYLMDGKPVEVNTQITIKFVLGTAKPSDSDHADMVVDTQQRPLILTKQHTAKPLGPDTVRVSPFDIVKYAQKQVKPDYPETAKKADVTGTVIVDVIIDKTGKVSDAEIAGGVPMFDDAALAAARQCTFRPYLVNGEAKNVATSLIFNFE